MLNPLDYPFLILAVSLLIFWTAAWVGSALRGRQSDQKKDDHDYFAFVLGGTLTMLGLIIGFSFSMAVNRYDQRKNYEEEEANAIGTEYARADLLPAAQAAQLRQLLAKYVE